MLSILNNKIKTFLALVLLASTTLQAQQDLSLHFMDHVWQSQQTNPAMMSDKKVTVGLVSPYFNFYNSGFSFDGIFKEIPGTDSVKLDMGQTIEDMWDRNSLQMQLNVDVLSLGLRFGKLQLGANYSIKGSGYMNYPKTMLDFAWNGNAGYIGKKAQVAPDFQVFAYNEIGISGAYQVMDKLSVGARVKILSGITNLSTANRDNEISIYTNPDDYAVTLTTDYRYNASGFPKIDSTFESLTDSFTVQKLFDGNLGTAFDLGATFKLNDKLEFGAGFNDMGFINWKKNIANYKSEGTYTYDGVDLQPLLSGDSISFGAIADTLADIFNIEQEQSITSYKTSLAAKVYLSARFKLKESLTFGGLFYSEIYRGRVEPGLALSVTKDFGKVLSLGGVYSIRNRQFANLGVNATLRLGPVHFFVLTDNIVTVFKPYDSRNFNGRIGLNIAVGSVE